MDKNYLVKAKIIKLNRINNEQVKNLIYDSARHNNSYVNYYICDGYYKPLSEHKEPEKAIFYEDKNKLDKHPYAYEIGDDIVSDWLLSEGFCTKDEIIFLVSW